MYRWVLAVTALGTASAAGLNAPSSAETCGRCHRSIHEAWSVSSHAHAMDSRLFQDALELAENDFGAGARKTCLGCHAPIAVRIGDLGLVQKVSWEGVTCDFCHSIRRVSTGPANVKVVLAFDGVKTGPLKDAISSAHGTQFSAVHTTSFVCATCHEYRNAQGFEVLTTYSEWKSGHHAKEGRECQSCHMSRVAGAVVDPRIQRTGMAKINLHAMPGSHSLEQLTSAVRAQLNAVRDGDQLKVTVDLTNATAGHSLPTGSPMRRIILEVRADSYGGRHYREERVYSRRVADAHGNEITREHVAFIQAAKVLSDTRLATGEKRTETFQFPINPGEQTQVQATLWYYYSPLARTDAQKRITFLSLSRLVR